MIFPLSITIDIFYITILHAQQSFQISSVKVFVPQKGEPQEQKLNLGNCSL